jgi:hypothetical protein
MMQQGEKYQCPNEECGCEINVTRASQLDDADQNPTCCCGEEMELVESGGAKSVAGRGGASSRSRR